MIFIPYQHKVQGGRSMTHVMQRTPHRAHNHERGLPNTEGLNAEQCGFFASYKDRQMNGTL
jgi:hypothetical protein